MLRGQGPPAFDPQVSDILSIMMDSRGVVAVSTVIIYSVCIYIYMPNEQIIPVSYSNKLFLG